MSRVYWHAWVQMKRLTIKQHCIHVVQTPVCFGVSARTSWGAHKILITTHVDMFAGAVFLHNKAARSTSKKPAVNRLAFVFYSTVLHRRNTRWHRCVCHLVWLLLLGQQAKQLTLMTTKVHLCAGTRCKYAEGV